MNTRKFLPFAALFLLAACNNSSKKSGGETDTTAKTDTMVMAPKAEVPALPAVPDNARVYFKNLKDGQTISSPFKLEMGADGMRVDTAGPVIAGVGHHHLFIDAEDSLAAGTMVPKDSSHVHFGKAQTEYDLKLSPGKHKLTLQMADGLHRSYGSRLAATVTVNVK